VDYVKDNFLPGRQFKDVYCIISPKKCPHPQGGILTCKKHTPNMNAYIESFNSILEDECYSRYEFETFAEAYEAISTYLDYYNHRRIYGSIGYMAPAVFFHKHLIASNSDEHKAA